MTKRSSSTIVPSYLPATTDLETSRDATRQEEATRFRNESSLVTSPGIKTGRRLKGKKKMAHFLGFLQHGIAGHHAVGMWRLPEDKVNLPSSQPEYWQAMGRTMERGLFDAMFIADEQAPYTAFKGNSDAIVKWGVQCPTHEPGALVPLVASATKHLGIGITLTNAFEHPYSMARRLSTMDHMSGGRTAWNIVSCYSTSEWEAYGREMTPRTHRYDMLDEYMDVCYKLWDSWEPNAIVEDYASGVYADPAKVHEVNHEGKYYKCHTRGFVERSPQVYPVLWQAGSSDRGRDFAAKHAEGIFSILPTVRTMKQYAEDFNNRLENRFDRPAGSVKLIYGLQVVVDVTRERAQEKYEFIKSKLPLEACLAIMAGHMGPDFSQFDLDAPVKYLEVPGAQGVLDAIVDLKDGAPVTLREAAEVYGLSMASPHAVGTPQDIADIMECYMDEGGADGFMLLATPTPQCFVDIVDLVVPEMQRRGRYRTQYNGPMLRDNLLQW